jgi:hypothetical protein
MLRAAPVESTDFACEDVVNRIAEPVWDTMVLFSVSTMAYGTAMRILE